MHRRGWLVDLGWRPFVKTKTIQDRYSTCMLSLSLLRASLSICRTRSRRQAEAFADFLERLGLLVVQAETHAQDGGFALVHLVEQVQDVLEVVGLDHFGVRRLGIAVHDHFVERPAGFGLIGLRGGVVDADRLLDDGQLLLGQVQSCGRLLPGSAAGPARPASLAVARRHLASSSTM